MKMLLLLIPKNNTVLVRTNYVLGELALIHTFFLSEYNSPYFKKMQIIRFGQNIKD
jgi:hypothetical protein